MEFKEEFRGKCCVYKITNKLNNKVYVGQTRDVGRRLREHRRGYKNDSKWNEDYNSHLYRSIRKYGEENFKFEVIKECSLEELGYWEIYYMRMYNSLDRNKGYNRRGVKDDRGSVYEEKVYRLIEDLKECKILKKDLELKYGVNRQSINGVNRGENYFVNGEEYPLRKLIESSIKKINDGSLNGRDFKIKVKNESRKGEEIEITNVCNDCGEEYFKSEGGCVSNKCGMKRKGKEYETIKEGERLKEELIEEPNFLKVSKRYGISDNALRKRCGKYGIPHKTSYYRGEYFKRYGVKYSPN